MTLKTELQPTFEISLDHKKTYTFEEAFLESVDTTVSLLGKSCKQAIYHHLKNSHGLNREAIPHKVAEFAVALESLFGKGALLLEVRMMHQLHDKVPSFKFHPRKDGLLFIAYVESLRRFMRA
jgi:hypothetical protein